MHLHHRFGLVTAVYADPAIVLVAQGTTSAEVQAVAAAQAHCSGSTAYLNLETGDCHGDSTSLSALIQAGVSRVVIGIRHPLAHCRGAAIQELRQHGVQVDVLGEAPCFESTGWEDSTLQKCFVANEVSSNVADKQWRTSCCSNVISCCGHLLAMAACCAPVYDPRHNVGSA